MSQSRPAKYSRNQLIGHWLVVLFVLMQFLLNGSMVEAFETGVELGAMPLDGGAIMHGVGGATIFLLMAWRLSMRLTHGAPPPPETEPDAIQKLSRGTHWAFYVVLLAMPLFGLAAVLTLAPWLGTLHTWAGWLLLLLIAMHVSGAVWHMVRKKDDTWQRMLRADPASEARTP